MKLHNKDLKRACYWQAAGKHEKVIRFLEPKVPLYLEDPDYYTILGKACLEHGNTKDAWIYLNRGLQIDPYNLNIRLCLAFNYLKRKDPAAALKIWLEILDDYPGNKYAVRGINSLKGLKSMESQERFIDRIHGRHYLPDLKNRWPKRIVFILAFSVILSSSFYYRNTLWNLVELQIMRMEQRPGTEIFAPDSRILIQEESDAVNSMTDREVSRALKKSLKHFKNYEDNSARFELNKIRHANISESISQQINLILESLAESTIQTIETNYTYREVSANPRLYEDCWILWTGVTANVEFNENEISFDFLVGYHEGEILEGRVSVVVPFLAVMEPLPLELLARVELNEGGFHLVAKTLHFQR